jgi:hypothetical protein
MFATGGSRNDRAVSNLLGYVLGVGLFTMVTVASLSVGFGVFSNAQESAQRTQMDHNSQVLAHTVEEVDRLSRASSSSERIAREVGLPTQVGGSGYTITVVDSGGESYLLFETDGEGVSDRVPFRASFDVEEVTLDGGRVVVVREAGGSEIKVQRDDA